MGIPSYFSYIIKNHAKIIKKLEDSTIQVNNLYSGWLCKYPEIVFSGIRQTSFFSIGSAWIIC